MDKLITLLIISTLLSSCKSVKKISTETEYLRNNYEELGKSRKTAIDSFAKHVEKSVTSTDSTVIVETIEFTTVVDTVSGNIVAIPKTAYKVKKEYKNSTSSESLAESNISKNHIEVDTTKTRESFSEITKTTSKIKRDSTAIARISYLLLAIVIIGYGVVRKYFPIIFVRVKQFIKL
jgi:hypothetical protein